MRAEGHYGRVVSRFILQSRAGQDLTVFGDGFQTRSFCYVSDTVAGMLQFMALEKLGGEVLNLGNPVETKIRDLARKIVDVTRPQSGVRLLPFPLGDHRRRAPSIEKAKEILHWTPSMGLDQGLKRTVEWVGSLVATVT